MSPTSGFKFFAIFLLLLPLQYPNGYCYKIALDVQNEMGMPIVVVFPLKQNGAYDSSKIGHVLNYAFIDEKYYYIDWKGQWIWDQSRFEQAMWFWYLHGWQSWISPDRPPFPFSVK